MVWYVLMEWEDGRGAFEESGVTFHAVELIACWPHLATMLISVK